ncbi:MAG TPA: HDOD domain-containing protein [Spirochaetota bacterium]|nr:HDOD domain-containing protein [Spirochaetota bacterium]HNT11731.1 HDOD domain-containing protein [Spirochaetota bacterium]
MKSVHEQVKDSIDRMPSLSPVIHKINEVANNINTSAQDLTDVIQLDPVLTAKVIRMVNSAYFGLPQVVSSLKQAVVMLGVNTIKNVALSSAFLGQVSLKGKTGLDGEDFWRHSLGVAVASKMIAKRLGVEDKLLEEYFIAGLIHDIGKVLVNNFFPEMMDKILALSEKNAGAITDIEKRVIGLTHEEIGIAIGKKWRFENNLLYAMGKHHRPVTSGSAAVFSMVVSVADTFVKILKVGFSGNHRIEPIPEEVWEVLQLNEETAFGTLASIGEEIRKAKLFLG